MFTDRRALYIAGVHRSNTQPVSVNSNLGVAESIYLAPSEKTLDYGEVIYFEGFGGTSSTGIRIANQSMQGMNAALALSSELEMPIRLVSGLTPDLKYRGLFAVDGAWASGNDEGFIVCSFRLVALSEKSAGADERTPNSRKESRVYLLVRDTALAAKVKLLYRYRCQFCGVATEIASGLYAEGAHIVPLSAEGDDALENILCLCPNHHVAFDHGGLQIADDWSVRTRSDTKLFDLTADPSHQISLHNIRRHRSLLGFRNADLNS